MCTAGDEGLPSSFLPSYLFLRNGGWIVCREITAPTPLPAEQALTVAFTGSLNTCEWPTNASKEEAKEQQGRVT